MKNNLNMKKKKKGFTLIELVIVLAVLAIIALIAIPNFTRVRNESLIDSDYRAAESIQKITLMAIANGDLATKKMDFTVAKNGVLAKGTGTTDDEMAKVKDLYREANGPQVPTDADGLFKIEIDANGAVDVGYGADTKFNRVQMNILAGPNAKEPVEVKGN